MIIAPQSQPNRLLVSPLLEQTNIAGAVGMIVNITAPPDFMMHELDEAMQVIKDTAPEAQIIFGLVYKDELELDDEVLVTVIATGFDADAGYAFESGTVGSGSASAQYDDADVYQRQPSTLSEQRMARAGRTRPSGRVSSGRSVTPTRGQRADTEQPVEQAQAPEGGGAGRKPASRREQGAPQRDTDWEIPAFLRVQKRNRNDK